MSDFASYRANRLMGFVPEALRRFYADAEALEAMYRAEQRCNSTESGFDLMCDRYECQREKCCAKVACARRA
jgi:hypothetical protein